MAAAVDTMMLTNYAEECALAVLDTTDTTATLAVEAGVRRESTKRLSKPALTEYNSKNRRGVKGSSMGVRGRERSLRSPLLSPG